MLKHLILVPQSGMCNRLRAVASAKRLCAMHAVKLSVVWEWGDPFLFFEPDSRVEWVSKLTPEMRSDAVSITHQNTAQGGSEKSRAIDVSKGEKLIVFSKFRFGDLRAFPAAELAPWFERPSKIVAERVATFKAGRFNKIVGMHIRRADNKFAQARSPDRLFFRNAKRLIRLGYHIFLATDNYATAQKMQKRFGGRIVIYPKNPDLKVRWPRAFNAQDSIDDLVDLHLLASCEFVIYSFFSSFGSTAAVLNGSARCKCLQCSAIEMRLRLSIEKYRAFIRRLFKFALKKLLRMSS